MCFSISVHYLYQPEVRQRLIQQRRRLARHLLSRRSGSAVRGGACRPRRRRRQVVQHVPAGEARECADTGRA